jgi:hypothetical protein
VNPGFLGEEYRPGNLIFRDWIETQTFEIAAPIALPLRLPLDYLKRTIIRQPAAVLPIDESRP